MGCIFASAIHVMLFSGREIRIEKKTLSDLQTAI